MPDDRAVDDPQGVAGPPGAIFESDPIEVTTPAARAAWRNETRPAPTADTRTAGNLPSMRRQAPALPRRYLAAVSSRRSPWRCREAPSLADTAGHRGWPEAADRPAPASEAGSRTSRWRDPRLLSSGSAGGMAVMPRGRPSGTDGDGRKPPTGRRMQPAGHVATGVSPGDSAPKGKMGTPASWPELVAGARLSRASHRATARCNPRTDSRRGDRSDPPAGDWRRSRAPHRGHSPPHPARDRGMQAPRVRRHATGPG